MAVGPVTNLSILLEKYPETKKNIKEVFLLAGAIYLGNISPTTEFNVGCDPEAAEYVFSKHSDLPLKVITIDFKDKLHMGKFFFYP